MLPVHSLIQHRLLRLMYLEANKQNLCEICSAKPNFRSSLEPQFENALVLGHEGFNRS